MTQPALIEQTAWQEQEAWTVRPSSVLNMSTGPVEVSKAVLTAQMAELLTPHSVEFWNLHDEAVALLGEVLRTKNRVLMTHGSIRTGIDLALGNLVQPGTKVLSIENGFWGALVADWAERRGGKVTRVSFGALEVVDVNRVAEVLAADTFDLVTLVHVETNSGIVNPVREVGKLVAATDALFFVDTACSAGAMRVETDDWAVDIQTTGSHKCLSSVPGLAIITVSEKAWCRLETTAWRGTYFDLRTWWLHAMERPTVPPFTQPTTLVLALRQALLEITAIGIENWWATHTKIADKFVGELRQLGFSLLLDSGPVAGQRELYSDTVIAVKYPDHVSDANFRRVLLEDFGIFVIGNVGEFANLSCRVGLMSPAQMQAVSLFGTIGAFGETVKSPRSWR